MTSRRENKIPARLRSIGLGVAVALGAAALGAVAWYQELAHSPQPPASYEGTKLGDAAPGFRLVDQNGALRSLEDFRGKVVVLTLLDPVCTDICPVYAYHYRLAHQTLGQDSANVAFLAFNANDEKTSVADTMAATKKWSADEIPSWHFLTGGADELRAVWKAYGMMASGPPKHDRHGEKQHSPSIYIIDQAGQRRWFFSTNFDDAPAPSALIVKHVRELLAEARRNQ